MNYLTLIPARKNSKRIKNKNLIKINGVSLIDRTIAAALKIKKKNFIIVSTDNEKILSKSKKFNKKKIEFLKRPKYLSKDSSSIESLVLNIIKNKFKNNKPKNIIVLQPTSPFRNHKHINNCIKKFEKKKLDSIFSVYKDKLFLWNNHLKSLTYNYKKRENTQKMKKSLIENGAIFIFKTKKFLKLKNKRRIFGKFDYFEMQKKYSLDIDGPEDLKKIK